MKGQRKREKNGQDSDYLYHGKTIFTGVHTGDHLRVNTREANEIRMSVPEDIFPEYYIIRVNEFNDVATTPIEEWLDYLKNNRIKDDTSTPGLQEAREKLLYMTMNVGDICSATGLSEQEIRLIH